MLLEKMGAGVAFPGAARLRKAAVFGFVITLSRGEPGPEEGMCPMGA